MNDLYEKLVNKKEKISLIGLGYVGMPIAIAFAKKLNVIGYDIDEKKIIEYQKGMDPTNEVGDEAVKETTTKFTADARQLIDAKFHIVAVPTPITKSNIPNLKPLEAATKTVGTYLTKGSIVVFESTVYPGVTEDICVPILEETSGLKYREDFKVGFSPERINPGDKENRLETIVKVVSGSDEEAVDTIAKVYELVVEAGVYRAESIKVAEAAKVIENAQRDINIAFMNELAMIFNRMNIDTKEVLKAAGTKWNFLDFVPGLVGGHCIGVDPYYLTYKSEMVGYHPKIVLAGRRINDKMGEFVVNNMIKQLIQAKINIQDAKVGILGFTFKENVPDTRNTRVIDIVRELEEYKIPVVIHDPYADYEEVYKEYGIKLNTYKELQDLDVVILAVAHDEYQTLSESFFETLYRPGKNGNKIMLDVKGQLDRNKALAAGYRYWRL
ncbi:MAG TPA: nucleotide sugar dehydrogenase [Candidatus Atopostipes pullistercoris]|uniref:Nucleotide sugar dehydrogenase n=1 Tax=Candidatus Atopostipes pullistercoris TaxID=2838467 RepID=A0A9D2G1N4_9LACT|nr:nucleotide sugar dehydrogenase [Candidatus Atopostipes pullistercoris]